jgi:hypothetical protein
MGIHRWAESWKQGVARQAVKQGDEKREADQASDAIAEEPSVITPCPPVSRALLEHYNTTLRMERRKVHPV